MHAPGLDLPLHRWARALAFATLACAPMALSTGALSNGWSLPGIDPVREPEPALTSALHERADAAREAAGLAPTVWDEGLARAARAHAAELAARGVLDHAGASPETRTLADRLVRAGVPYASVGENLAFERGFEDPVGTMVQGWLASPPHRANLLDPQFDRVGYGSARDASGARYVVQVFAAARWLPSRASAHLETTVAYRLRLDVAVNAPTSVAGVLELNGGAERLTWTPGPVRLERTVAALPATLRLAVDVGRTAFSVDESGTVDDAGVWRAGSAPRRWLEVASSAAAPFVQTLVRVRFDVDPAVGAVLLVDGQHVPEASLEPGRLDAAVPLADGANVALALAEPLGDGRLRVRHALFAERRGDEVVLAAGR
ncbi:MAG: CAP domain-containing protein [Trueperaceae bacterium]